MIMPRSEADLTYESYLRLTELLSLQTPRSNPPAHDELQFIIVHQAYELWFRLLIHEVRAIITHLQAGEVREAIWLLRRLIEIERVMTQQVQVLETMSPPRFLEFRDLLKPASGLQSLQFRELEFLSGLCDERFLELFNGTGEARRRLRAALKGPNLWSAFCDLLHSWGFDVVDAERQVEAVAQIYSNPRHLDLHQLCEAMIEYDEQFRAWRARHALMAERMIGAKPGTGDPHTGRLAGRESFQEPGVRYLQGRVGLRFFPILWEVRTRLGRGSYGG
jgi:tryptophan 2,3-dioxygenase